MPLDYQRPPDWLTSPEPMTLEATVVGRSNMVELLADAFSFIEECGLEVKRVEVPPTWRSGVPVEDGFLWGAWVAESEGRFAAVQSPRKGGVCLRTVLLKPPG